MPGRGEAAATERLLLVARKAGFGLPTACPSCLPVYLYLRFANAPFDLRFDRLHPDSDTVPYVELGDYVAFNNENGGVIEGLKQDGVVDLDSHLSRLPQPDWLPTKAMVSTWLADAVSYELWVASDGSVADEIYFSDLPWPIRKILHWKQSRLAKNLLQITQADTSEIEKEIYRRAGDAYEALSMRLGEQKFFFEDRPTSLDAIFLGHVLFVLHALPDSSMLKSLAVKHGNLVRYVENLSMEFLEASSSSSSSSIPRSCVDPSTSSTPKQRGSSRWSSKPKHKAKKERTEEEKTFRRRAKYFLAAQLISVLVFLTIMGGSRDADFEVDDDEDDEGLNY